MPRRPRGGADDDVLNAAARTVDTTLVVELADVWRTGASRWTVNKRLRYANDPLVLLAV